MKKKEQVLRDWRTPSKLTNLHIMEVPKKESERGRKYNGRNNGQTFPNLIKILTI